MIINEEILNGQTTIVRVRNGEDERELCKELDRLGYISFCQEPLINNRWNMYTRDLCYRIYTNRYNTKMVNYGSVNTYLEMKEVRSNEEIYEIADLKNIEYLYKEI